MRTRPITKVSVVAVAGRQACATAARRGVNGRVLAVAAATEDGVADTRRGGGGCVWSPQSRVKLCPKRDKMQSIAHGGKQSP